MRYRGFAITGTVKTGEMFHALAAGLAACLLCAVPVAGAAADTDGSTTGHGFVS